MATEHTFTDEATAYAERRTFINRGISVSLIAFDPERNAYVFDTYPRDVDDVRECGGCEDEENHPHAFDCERA